MLLCRPPPRYYLLLVVVPPRYYAQDHYYLLLAPKTSLFTTYYITRNKCREMKSRLFYIPLERVDKEKSRLHFYNFALLFSVLIVNVRHLGRFEGFIVIRYICI